MRSVSATRASIANAGWQHVKTSRRRSSSMAPGGCAGSSYDIRASCCLPARFCSRRIRSMALRVAVVVRGHPGWEGGRPAAIAPPRSRTHAAAASSAMSRSPNRRARLATTRAHSSWCVCVTASWTPISFTRRGTAAPRPSGCTPSSPAASLSATSRSAASMIQNPATHFFRLHVGPVRDQHLVARWSMTVAVSGDPRPFA